MAQDHGVAMAIHMAESPIAAMAAAHVAVATENFMALEYHSVDVDWWDDIVTGVPKPLVKDGFITVPDKPGLGIDDVVDEVICSICSRASTASGSRRTTGTTNIPGTAPGADAPPLRKVRTGKHEDH